MSSPDYRVDIEPAGKLWKVSWYATVPGSEEARPYRPYHLYPKEIQQLAGSIRDLLKRLVTDSTAGKLANGERSSVAPVLNELARQGNRLYTIFFIDELGKNQDAANLIRATLSQRSDRPTIHFKVDQEVHIPWGLMSETPVLQSTGQHSDYPSFWALKYSVATLYDRLFAAEEFSKPFAADQFDALLAVDALFHQKASARLQASDPESQLFSMLADRYQAPSTDSKSLLTAWENRRDRLGLLYLYCHSDEGKIAFSDTDILDTIDFKSDYTKDATPPRCLVFLNGCHTAVGEFLRVTGREGFCGFIGTETVLPYMFGHRFGAAVIASLYAGERLDAIMDRLRVQHWPLSLVYGFYAYPFLQLEPCFTMPTLLGHNYSDLDVGDTTI